VIFNHFFCSPISFLIFFLLSLIINYKIIDSSTCRHFLLKNYSSSNGRFYYHLNCLQTLRNKERDPTSTSIWKSKVFANFLDSYVKTTVINEGYSIDINYLKTIFMQFLSDADLTTTEIRNQDLKSHLLANRELSGQLRFLKPNHLLQQMIRK